MSEFLKIRHGLKAQASSFECEAVADNVPRLYEACLQKIEKVSYRGKPAVRLIGSLQSEHIAQIQAEMAAGAPVSVLDLEELMSVDLAVVQFLCRCETGGVEIIHCSPYVMEWMRQERKAQPDRTE